METCREREGGMDGGKRMVEEMDRGGRVGREEECLEFRDYI